MRFIITAQAGADETTVDQDAGFDEKLFAAHMRFNEELHKAGVLVACEGLNPAAKGARVAVCGGKRQVVDGPFAESKELVGGFYIIDVDSLEDAIQWALRAPVGMHFDDVLEIRQLTGAGDIPSEILEIMSAAAPTWSTSWKARG
ncbi:MAG: YciI family protein [Ideonella sp.]